MKGYTFVLLTTVLITFLFSREAFPQNCEYPNVLVVLDKSSSMYYDNKWNDAKSAINSLVTQYDSSINFGMMILS